MKSEWVSIHVFRSLLTCDVGLFSHVTLVSFGSTPQCQNQRDDREPVVSFHEWKSLWTCVVGLFWHAAHHSENPGETLESQWVSFHVCKSLFMYSQSRLGWHFWMLKIKARTSLLPRFSENRRWSFELWNSIRTCHPKWVRLYTSLFWHVS